MAPDGFLLENSFPQAPATWLRTCCCPWLSWKGRSLFQGVPAAPPSPSSVRSLSSRGWCWVFGQDHLPHEEAHSLWWAAGEHTPSEARLLGGLEERSWWAHSGEKPSAPQPSPPTWGLQCMSQPRQQQAEPLCWLLCCRWSG